MKHPLDRYLWENDIDQDVFAAAVGVHPSTISRICKHGHIPKLKVALKIQEATNGIVKLEDLINAV